MTSNTYLFQSILHVHLRYVMSPSEIYTSSPSKWTKVPKTYKASLTPLASPCRKHARSKRKFSGAVEDFASFEKAKDEKIDRLSAATDYVQSSRHTDLVKRH